jgi:D-sedoheptulose 7-phosphate isomerase
MAADLGKLCNIDAQSFDNLAELTARANDEGWHTIFDGFLSRATKDDALFILSVGGGTPTVSVPLVQAINSFPGDIFGIVGPIGGYTAQKANIAIRIPVGNGRHVTPHTEAFQAVVWHCLVSHPLLQKRATKW